MKPVYRLLPAGVEIKAGDQVMTSLGWSPMIVGFLVWPLTHGVYLYRRRCTPREAAMARKMGLVK